MKSETSRYSPFQAVRERRTGFLRHCVDMQRSGRPSCSFSSCVELLRLWLVGLVQFQRLPWGKRGQQNKKRDQALQPNAAYQYGMPLETNGGEVHGNTPAANSQLFREWAGVQAE